MVRMVYRVRFDSFADIGWMICIHIKKQNEYCEEYRKPKWLVKGCENIGYYTFKYFHFFSPRYSSCFSFLFQIFK